MRVENPQPAFLRLLGSAVGLVALGWARALATDSWAPDHGPLPVPGRLAALVALIALLGNAAHAYWALLRAAERRPVLTRDWLQRALALAGVAALMPPLLSNDLFSVLSYVDLWLSRHVNPLTLGAGDLPATPFSLLVSPAWRDAPCVYGPLQLLVWAPAVGLGATPGRAVALANLISLATGVLVLLALYRYCREQATGGARRFALVAFCPLLWIEGVGQAHNDLLVALLVVLWLSFAAKGRTALAALALGAAVAAKLTALLLAACYVVYLLAQAARQRREWHVPLLVAGVMALTVGALYGPFWDGGQTFARPLAYLAHRRPSNTLALPVWQALRALGLSADSALAAVSPVQGVLTLAVGCVAFVASLRARSIPALAASMAGCLALLATLGTSVFQPWYLLPALVLAVEVEGPAWRRWLVLVAPLAPLLDGSALLAPRETARAVYTAITVAAACVAWLLWLRLRLGELWAAPQAGPGGSGLAPLQGEDGFRPLPRS
jgi:hypothetical protein